MTTGITSHTIDFASGETIALDLRNTVWPKGFVIRPSAGATVTRKLSVGDRPGNKFASPPQNTTTTTNFPFDQIAPVSFAQFAASGAGAAIDISAVRAADIVVHNSVSDTVTALTAPSPSIAVGESVSFKPHELFSYAKGALDLSATSADAGDATVAVDPNSGEVTITGVAAVASVNVTVVATTPTETSANLVIGVTVTA